MTFFRLWNHGLHRHSMTTRMGYSLNSLNTVLSMIIWQSSKGLPIESSAYHLHSCWVVLFLAYCQTYAARFRRCNLFLYPRSLRLRNSRKISYWTDDAANVLHPSRPTTPHTTTFPSPSTSKPSFVHCTPDEIAFCRKKGLCYNCDEKWNSNHRCKGRILLFIANLTQIPRLFPLHQNP